MHNTLKFAFCTAVALAAFGQAKAPEIPADVRISLLSARLKLTQTELDREKASAAFFVSLTDPQKEQYRAMQGTAGLVEARKTEAKAREDQAAAICGAALIVSEDATCAPKPKAP